MAPRTQVNGALHSFCDISSTLASFATKELQAIDYEYTVDREQQFGNDRQGIGWTRGQLKNEASFTLTLRAWRAMKRSMGRGYLDLVFNITVSYSNDVDEIITDELIRCRIGGVKRQFKVGPEGLMVEIALHIDGILDDDIEPIEGFQR